MVRSLNRSCLRKLLPGWGPKQPGRKAGRASSAGLLNNVSTSGLWNPSWFRQHNKVYVHFCGDWHSPFSGITIPANPMKFSRAATPLIALVFALSASASDSARWVGTWTSAPQLTEERNLPPEPGLVDTTLRQVIRVSIAGERMRLRFSNAFGDRPLELKAVHVAQAVQPGQSDIIPETDRVLTFQGATAVIIPVGALMVSDPIDFPLRPMMDLAVTVYVQDPSRHITGHPGSRTTSFLQSGEAVANVSLPDAARTEHWYYLSGVEVWAAASPGAIVVVGDSITDGRGSTTNGNDRWPDQLLRRLQADERTAAIAVLNQGIGGNTLIRGGLGPNALARLDRDVLAQPGVRWLIVFEGINDLGGAAGARARGERATTADDLIGALEQIIRRAQARGLKVYGGTILACGGSFYENPQSEADRQTVNTWIRTSRRFDAVIDFDAATRDPENPSRLRADVDVGDHLHLNPTGYRVMAGAIDPGLFVD